MGCVKWRFKPVAEFCGEYEPLAYVIEGVLRSGSLYTLTAKTGTGKTALNVMVALAVAIGEGQSLLGCDVAQGRVAYIALENPDDVRMRFLAAAHRYDIDINDLGDRLVILDRREKTEEIWDELGRLSEDGPFRLVIVDTFAAHFDGDDANNSVQGGNFMRRYRPITQLRGRPTVLVSAHPVKHAAEDNLVPQGSGAILNEVDGNLTLSKQRGAITLHWGGKLRGPDFEALSFMFESRPCPAVLDAKGRQVAAPVLLPATARAHAKGGKSDLDGGSELLVAMAKNPNGTQHQWAEAIGCAKSTVNSRLQRLKSGGAVENRDGKWSITRKGRSVIEGEIELAGDC
jgi:hypothetical protein